MALYLNKPSYPCDPIRTVAALARMLRMNETELLRICDRAHASWRMVKPEPGTTRETFDAHGPLKAIHKQLKNRIFSRVYFPDYLQGSLKGRDYVSNAILHKNKQILICEDVKKFFPSVSAMFVEDVWRSFFRFSPEVANILTRLTTKDGALPQGAITSSFLANLVMWRHEPLLQAKLEAMGITYSRYVDDMSMSSTVRLDTTTQTKVIGMVYGMLAAHGLRAARHKHQVFSASQQMIATKLIVNRKPSLSSAKRSAIRAQVHQLEMAAESGTNETELRELANKASQRVGQLARFHKRSGERLRDRVKMTRMKLLEQTS
jgi:Reverse transcriptase (RNA-dependent DNA polymerase)